jgi:hypothetical protein
MLEHAFKSWVVWKARVPSQYRVFERDGGAASRAALPASKWRDHHFDGGSDALENGTTLCA